MTAAQPTPPPIPSNTPPLPAGLDSEIYDRYSPLVRRLAMRTIRRVPQGVSMDDILSAGWLGLVEARRRREACPTEAQFEAYAAHRVRGAMLDYLRSLDPMSRRHRQASRSISNAIRELTQQRGRPPTEQEIADYLGLSIEAYQDTLAEMGRSDAVRLDSYDIGTVAARSSPGPDEIVEERELVNVVADAIRELPERLQLVMGLYYQEDLSLAEIGAVLGVTESRVCQIHTECICRLRAALDVAHDKPAKRKTRTRSKNHG